MAPEPTHVPPQMGERRDAGGAANIPPLEYSSRFKRFLHHDMVGSLWLLTGAVAAVVIANIGFEHEYHEFWETPFGLHIGERELEKSLHHWVNDGLMCIFFFLVGLEIKRELLVGELANFRKALLPAVAALGGMLVPALVYAVFNARGEGSHGWGIPMATDIAFAAGCLALLKKWVTPALMVFLVALAIVDDLGAVAVIALFYTDRIDVEPLMVGSSLIIFSFILGQLGVRRTLPYAIFGIIIWVAFLESGIHATVAGVLLAFSIPADAVYKRGLFEGRMMELISRFVKAEDEWNHDHPPEPGVNRAVPERIVNHRQQAVIRAMNTECHHVEAPLQRLEHNIEPFTVFLVLPIFAFANAGVYIEWANIGEILREPVTLGVLFGLLIGKPLGITLFALLAVKAGWAELPRGVNWGQVAGVGFLAGIGFTMALFINGLAFLHGDPVFQQQHTMEGKVGIFIASFCAAVIGLLVIKMSSKQRQEILVNGDL